MYAFKSSTSQCLEEYMERKLLRTSRTAQRTASQPARKVDAKDFETLINHLLRKALRDEDFIRQVLLLFAIVAQAARQALGDDKTDRRCNIWDDVDIPAWIGLTHRLKLTFQGETVLIRCFSKYVTFHENKQLTCTISSKQTHKHTKHKHYSFLTKFNRQPFATLQHIWEHK